MEKICYYHSTQYYSLSKYLYETKCKKSSDILCETIATVGMPQTFKNLRFPKMTEFKTQKKKVTNINLRIISKPHAHLQTMTNLTPVKFQKDWHKTVGQWKLKVST